MADEIPHDIVDEILLVDDNSSDDTIIVAKQTGLRFSAMIETMDTVEIKRPVTSRLSGEAQISLS